MPSHPGLNIFNNVRFDAIPSRTKVVLIMFGCMPSNTGLEVWYRGTNGKRGRRVEGKTWRRVAWRGRGGGVVESVEWIGVGGWGGGWRVGGLDAWSGLRV